MARLRPSGFAGHHASPFGHHVAAPREARRAKRGGARRDRTADLVIANDALSQLSYGPLRNRLDVSDGGEAIGAIYNPRQGQVKNGEIGVSAAFGPELPLFAEGGTDI